MANTKRGVKRRNNPTSSTKRTSLPAQTPKTSDTLAISKMSEKIVSPRSLVAEDMSKMEITASGSKTPSQASKRAKNDMETEEEVDTILIDQFGNLPAGQLLSLGQGITGQLGLGPDMTSRKKPYPIKDLLDEKIKVIAAGGMHSACITDEHKIYTFGCNDEGALGRKCADDDEETLPKEVVLPEGAGRAVSITAGDSHCAVLDEFGKVYVWGNFRDGSGVLGLADFKSKEVKPMALVLDEFVVKIVSGSDHLVLLSKKGVAFTFGSGGVGQLGRGGRYFSDRGGRRGPKYVLQPAPVRFSMARQRNASVPEVSAASAKPSPAKAVVDEIFAAGLSTFIVCHGQVYSFGLNNYQQLGHQDKENRFAPTISPEYSHHNWKQIVGGDHHCIGLTNDNQVLSIGRGDDGRLGTQNSENKNFEETGKLQAVKMADLEEGDKVESVSSFGSVGYAVTQKGKGFVWGFGENLQLTTGEEDDEDLPVPMQGGRLEGKRILSAAVGGQHGLVLISLDE